MTSGELRSIDRYGRFVLLAVFVVLLGGRFTFDRLGPFPAWDLRLGALVVAGVLCLVWATVAREKTPAVRVGPLAGWFAAWIAWMALSAFWAPPGARVGAALLDLAVMAALVAIGWGAAARVHPRVLGALWWALFITGLLYLAGAAAAGPDVQGRYSAFGGGPNVFVRVMALAVLSALFLAITRRHHWALWGILPFLYGAYLSGSRGGLLALVAVVLVGGRPLVRRVPSKVWGSLAVFTFAAALLAPFATWSWLGVMRERFVEQTFEQGYDSGRSEILDRALQVFNEHLWIGSGLDGYYALQGYGATFEYPHNLVVASAAEGGLVAVGLVVGALVAGAVQLRQARPLPADALGFALCALFMLVASMFSGDYYDSRFLWFFLGLAVIAGRQMVSAPLEAVPREHAITVH